MGFGGLISLGTAPWGGGPMGRNHEPVSQKRDVGSGPLATGPRGPNWDPKLAATDHISGVLQRKANRLIDKLAAT